MYFGNSFELKNSSFSNEDENFEKASIEEHKEGNHYYSEEKHVFSLFPCMNKVICAIKENGYKVPESTLDSKEIKQLFACSKKALPPKK